MTDQRPLRATCGSTRPFPGGDLVCLKTAGHDEDEVHGTYLFSWRDAPDGPVTKAREGESHDGR